MPSLDELNAMLAAVDFDEIDAVEYAVEFDAFATWANCGVVILP